LVIKVLGKGFSTPFSRGILAQRLSATGLDPKKAYSIAERLLLELQNKQVQEISTEELDERIIEILLGEVGETTAKRFLMYRKLRQLEEPIIILISGTTGVGKSTIASMLASRLNIHYVIGTDIIREVFRKVLSKELFPSLHTSTYMAWKELKRYIPPTYSREILGYEEQAKLVTVGIEAISQRAFVEGISMVIEGVHISPNLIAKEFLGNLNTIFMFLNLKDEKVHRERFHSRATNVVIKRPIEKYLENFDSIRKIQDYLREQARITDIPIIENQNIDDTLKTMLDFVYHAIECIVTSKLSPEEIELLKITKKSNF